MKTQHTVYFFDAREMKSIASESIDLVVTSPPYPMIEMWDEVFGNQDPKIKQALEENDDSTAFELMHGILDSIWSEINRVLRPGGIACINIGNATRTIDGNFKLFPNNSRILQYCSKIGFQALPEILWRKQSNAPNKFMGSGMMPPGAYVTLEHEFILIFRKGGKREFKNANEKLNRLQSAFFWEERNTWFSDVWFDLKGTNQKLNDLNLRQRSAAFPFELAYRLISMFSVRGDMVLDPFLGTGTTILAAMATGRNSTGIEFDQNFRGNILKRTQDIVSFSNDYIDNRLDRHIDFVKQRTDTNGPLKYTNRPYNFPVMTKQEIELIIPYLKKIIELKNDDHEIQLEVELEDKARRKEIKNLFEFLDPHKE